MAGVAGLFLAPFLLLSGGSLAVTAAGVDSAPPADAHRGPAAAGGR